MTIDDFMNDPEADAELRAGTKRRPKVTQEEHKRYVQDRLLEACGRLDISSVERQYQAAVSSVRELSVVPQARDISDFCARNLALHPNVLGIFASALVNTVEGLEQPIVLEIMKGVRVDYFGYRLSRDVVVKGDLGDHTAERMERGNLTVNGNCHGVVGLYMGDPNQHHHPRIMVQGSISDYGAIIYSGEIRAGKNKKNYYSFSGKDDLQSELSWDQFMLFSKQLEQLRLEEPFDIDENFRRMVHPALVKIAVTYNISKYEHQIAHTQSRFAALGADTKIISDTYERDLKKSGGTTWGIMLCAIGSVTANPILFIPGMGLSIFEGVKAQKKVNSLRANRDYALSSIGEEQKKLETTIWEKRQKISELNGLLYLVNYRT